MGGGSEGQREKCRGTGDTVLIDDEGYIVHRRRRCVTLIEQINPCPPLSLRFRNSSGRNLSLYGARYDHPPPPSPSHNSS